MRIFVFIFRVCNLVSAFIKSRESKKSFSRFVIRVKRNLELAYRVNGFLRLSIFPCDNEFLDPCENYFGKLYWAMNKIGFCQIIESLLIIPIPVEIMPPGVRSTNHIFCYLGQYLIFGTHFCANESICCAALSGVWNI